MTNTIIQRIPLCVLILIGSLLGCDKYSKSPISENEVHEFLNLVLNDTSLIKSFHKDVPISNFNTNTIPLIGGRFVDVLSAALNESDTSFLKLQLKDWRTFNYAGLKRFDLRIIDLKEMFVKKIPQDSIWSIIHRDYSGYYSVSKPIFNRRHDRVYFSFGYSCGPHCGGGMHLVLGKKDGKWILSDNLGFWES